MNMHMYSARYHVMQARGVLVNMHYSCPATSFPGSLSPRSWGRRERDPGNEVACPVGTKARSWTVIFVKTNQAKQDIFSSQITGK